jgi:hypothetical protein
MTTPSHNQQEADVAVEYAREDFALSPNDARIVSKTREATPLDWANVLSMALKALKRQANFVGIAQIITASTPVLVLNAQPRAYLIVQNNDPANVVYFGVGFQPSAGFGIQIAALGNYEPLVVPQGDIWLNANGTAQVTILYALDYAPDANFTLPLA